MVTHGHRDGDDVVEPAGAAAGDVQRRVRDGNFGQGGEVAAGEVVRARERLASVGVEHDPRPRRHARVERRDGGRPREDGLDDAQRRPGRPSACAPRAARHRAADAAAGGRKRAG